MNPANHPLNHCGAPEAPYDRVERDLHTLLTAALDRPDTAPGECVDEFADEFLGNWVMPPRRRCRTVW